MCLFNGAQVIGQVVLGWVSDWINVFLLLGVSTLGSAAIAGFLWYPATAFGHIVAFSILFGLFAGGYSVLWPRFIAVLTQNPATSLWLYGLLAFQRGLGNIVSGPISIALFKHSAKHAESDKSPKAYKTLIIFVVVCLSISSLGGLSYCFGARTPKQTEKEDAELRK